MPTKIKLKNLPLLRNPQITINLHSAILRRLGNLPKPARNPEFPINFLGKLLSFKSKLFETFVGSSPKVFPELTGGEAAGKVVEIAAARGAERSGVARGEKVRVVEMERLGFGREGGAPWKACRHGGYLCVCREIGRAHV